MAPEPASFRWSRRLRGVLFVAAGGAIVFIVLRAGLISWPSADETPRLAGLTPVARPRRNVEIPVDARGVCRDLVARFGDGFEKRTHRESAPLKRFAAQRDGANAHIDNLADASIDFARDIRPLLANHCYSCHGPDRQEAGLRFDRRETVFQAKESGAIPVVAGDPTRSELIVRITAADPSARMPPEGPALSPQETLRLRRWISDGAVWPDDARHWSFIKPRFVPPPATSDPDWPRNVIDRFIAARRDREELPHTAEADRSTLIRRLSLDLIGLPPTPDEVDAFVIDPRADAYERLVDRLLASPRFGEKWAIRWLDLARFADTNGFEFDAARKMWLYRDWVINALNGDMPFDQFTVEQLAGDLLPGAATSQRVATGFLRNSPVAPDTLTHRYYMLVDRVNTLGATWLGMTFECAQCHDHKFDPLTQREYYQLYAIFNNAIDEVAGVGYAGPILKAKSPLTGESATTLVLEERTEPNVTHVKIGGSPSEDGERVEPGVPDFLHPARCGEADRLSLACWLIDENNPLTARVAVNRIWESLFGTGIVRTSGDFGVRGEPPSHPDLLDWLAIEFQRNGWSTKHIIRLIVCSSTYRQSSQRSPEAQSRDPQNRLLAYGPRLRLDAELLRDVVLAASGLLCTEMGGPSVFPWQPPGTSENVEFASFDWDVSKGTDQYRRGLYTFWKRRTPYPSFAIFDAPSRTSTCTRRERTTNPLQALVALNDPVFFEAAIHLGGRMLEETGGSAAAAITRGFRLCVGRKPTEEESELLKRLYQAERERLTGDIDAAIAMIGGEEVRARHPERDVSEWAAWTMVANVLLSLDETITRE